MGGNVRSIMCESKEISILQRRVAIAVYQTKDGVSIMIEGGDKGHIGAVAVAEKGKIIESISFPAHKEEVICRSWAEKISAVYPGPVVVEAGIHYDGITRGQIQEVMERLNEELEELTGRLAGGK